MRYLYIALAIIVMSCKKDPTIVDLNNLNGYWEITSVQTANGETIDYSFNESVDFIEFNDTQGVRTKVKPQLDGSFIKSNDAEGFTAETLDAQITLKYVTSFDTWKETILYLDDSKLKTKNDKDITYTYSRFTGYLDHGKKK